MKTNKKTRRIIAVGILIMSGGLLLRQYFLSISDFWFGILQGVGIGIMILGLIKMKKERETC